MSEAVKKKKSGQEQNELDYDSLFKVLIIL